jgi:hypothetical protein
MVQIYKMRLIICNQLGWRITVTHVFPDSVSVAKHFGVSVSYDTAVLSSSASAC